jgi:lysophospholipase L1-like esterase
VNPATKELTWPGTGVTFAFTGTSAAIGVAAVSGGNSVNLVIDDGEPVIISEFTAGTAINTPALPHGNHTVVLRKRSEAQYGTMALGDITTDGHLLAAPAASKRQIDIIGDSISVGYGLDGIFPCSDSAAVQNNLKTYGPVAAAALDADYQVMAWSGKGLIRNIAIAGPDTSPLLPQLYTRYGALDADGSYPFPASWSPQAVVIALGTNDFNYLMWDSSGQAYKARDPVDAAAFSDGMVAFVESIRAEHYPDAHFFLVTSPLLNDNYPSAEDAQKTTQTKALTDAIARLGETAHLIDWPAQGSEVGCDYHPNAATNVVAADMLVEAIGAALGW